MRVLSRLTPAGRASTTSRCWTEDEPMDAHGRLVTAIFLTGPDVEADRRPDAHAAYIQADGGARPHVQWCVADGAVRADVPADAAAHGEPDDRAGSCADVRVSVDNLTRARLRQSRRR